MQPMQSIFNSRMEPIQTHEEYPKYARSETKPVVRARHIIDQGVISDRPCSTCVELKQDCYRWEGTFSKCAYCTSKDRKKELCHLPGQEAAASSPQQERRKRRKITGNIYAPTGATASTADTTMAGTPVTGPLAPVTTTPVPTVTPTSKPKSVHSPERTPTTTTTMTGPTYPQAAAPAASSEAVQAEATLERVAALENKVSSLEATVLGLLVRLDEVSSCVGSNSTFPTPRREEKHERAAAGASLSSSPVTSNDVTTSEDSQHLPNTAAITTTTVTAPPPPPPQPAVPNVASATREGPKVQNASLSSSSSPAEDIATIVVGEEDAGRRGEEGPEEQQRHSIEHPEGYRPVNCSCTTG